MIVIGNFQEDMLLGRGVASRIRADCTVEELMLDRRGFLSSLAGAAGVAGTLSLSPAWPKLLEQAPAQLPDHALLDSNEEAYWTELRKQFLIPPDEIYLNNGTVGSSPAPVLRAIFEG